ncbi:MAG: hypothetical protein Q9164_000040 [Protoblastenia rupestris]
MPSKATPRRRQPLRGARATSVEHESIREQLSASSSKEPYQTDEKDDEQEHTELAAPNSSNPPLSNHIDSHDRSTYGPASSITSPPPSSRPRRDRLTSVLPQNSGHSASRPKNLKFQPKTFLRRDKTERDRLEKAEAERQAARQGGSSTSAHSRGAFSERGRGGYDGKGDLRRNRNEVSHQASGPLGGGVVKEKALPSSRSTRGGARGTVARDMSVEEMESIPAEMSTTRVKPEPIVKPEAERGVEADVVRFSSRPKNSATASKTKVKKEEDGAVYLSDDAEWDDDRAPKVDIQQINLISDDEDEDQVEPSEAAKGKQRERKPKTPTWQFRPVRLQRHEHVERHVGVNTDASSLTSAELRKRAKERQEADGPLFLSEGAADVISKLGSRERGKGRDLKFVRGRRKWKGVWQEDEDEDIKFKEEPVEEGTNLIHDNRAEEERPGSDVMEVDVEQATAGAKAPATIDEEVLPDADDDAVQANDARVFKDGALPQPVERGLKIKGFKNTDSILLADEEESEGHEDTDFADIIELWKKFHERDEDNAIVTAAATSVKDLNDGQNSEASDLKGDAYREQRPYLMQIPPIVPSLRDSTKPTSKIKTEDKHRATKPVPESSANPFSTPIKSDPDIKDDPDAMTTEPNIPNAYTVTTLQPPPGRIGTITMYDSGRMIADWGGTTLEVKRESHEAGFSQEVLLTEYESTMIKVEGKETWEETIKVGGGTRKAWSVGNIEGGFVGGPDWGTLLG